MTSLFSPQKGLHVSPLPIDSLEECALCDTDPVGVATRTVDGDAVCEGCFAHDFDVCGQCGAWTRLDSFVEVQTEPLGWSSPAVWEEFCPACAPSDPRNYPD
jgi:hypothetical protein